MSKHRQSKINWKRFEELVGRLEQMLGTSGIKVKINDHIRDKAGQLRQIDASVRVNTGTTELLYIIECRNRHKVSDVTWVEQVATKCRRVGAVKAILVSNQPLTSNALAAAKDENIEVRTLEELNGSVLDSVERPWMRMSRVHWSRAARIELHYAKTDEVSMEEYEQIHGLAMAGGDGIRFAIPHHNEPRSIEEIVTEVLEALKYKSFPPGERGGLAIAEIVRAGSTVELLYKDHRLRIKSLRVMFEGIVEEIAPSKDFAGRYEHPEGAINHIVGEHSFEENGEELTFTTAAQKDDRRFVVNIPYNFVEPELRSAIDKDKGSTIELFIDENNQPQVRRLD